jgi:hypothetical protein
MTLTIFARVLDRKPTRTDELGLTDTVSDTVTGTRHGLVTIWQSEASHSAGRK